MAIVDHLSRSSHAIRIADRHHGVARLGSRLDNFPVEKGMGFRDYPCTIVSDIEEWRIDHSTERRIGADAAETSVASQRRTGTFQIRPEFATSDSWKW